MPARNGDPGLPEGQGLSHERTPRSRSATTRSVTWVYRSLRWSEGWWSYWAVSFRSRDHFAETASGHGARPATTREPRRRWFRRGEWSGPEPDARSGRSGEWRSDHAEEGDIRTLMEHHHPRQGSFAVSWAGRPGTASRPSSFSTDFLRSTIPMSPVYRSRPNKPLG